MDPQPGGAAEVAGGLPSRPWPPPHPHLGQPGRDEEVLQASEASRHLPPLPALSSSLKAPPLNPQRGLLLKFAWKNRGVASLFLFL